MKLALMKQTADAAKQCNASKPPANKRAKTKRDRISNATMRTAYQPAGMLTNTDSSSLPAYMPLHALAWILVTMLMAPLSSAAFFRPGLHERFQRLREGDAAAWLIAEVMPHNQHLLFLHRYACTCNSCLDSASGMLGSRGSSNGLFCMLQQYSSNSPDNSSRWYMAPTPIRAASSS